MEILDFPIAHHFSFRFKKTNFHLVSVKHAIRAVVQPFPQIYIPAAAIFKLPVDGQVPVAEDEIIGLYTLVDFPVAILQEPFLFFAEPVALFGRRGGAAFLGRKIGQAGTQIGVKPAEQPLAEGVNKYFFHPFVSLVVRPEAVAVTDHKRFAVYFTEYRLPVYWNTELLFKIAEHPQIVVAGKHINRQTAIPQLRQNAKKPAESLGNHRFIFKPELKKIADQVNGICLRGDLMQPAYQLAFAFGACQAGIGAQMEIGSKKGFF